MAELTVESTYGKALYEAAVATDKVELILNEIEEIQKAFRAEPGFFEFLKTPVISGADKKEVIRKIFEGRISSEVLNFLYVLIDKGRGHNFEKIVAQYEKFMDSADGISTGTISSVVPLSADQLASFEEKTGKLLQKTVRLENRTDSSILGGVQIFIDGKIIDATIKKRLMDLKENLI